MINAKREFMQHVEYPEAVLCATITYGDCMLFGEDYATKSFNLSVNHTAEQYHQFVESLDFNYYNGYGGQELFGCIWFKDGTWSNRGEYDGSEWWEHNRLPAIPNELK
jgi:hypothetical protein